MLLLWRWSTAIQFASVAMIAAFEPAGPIELQDCGYSFSGGPRDIVTSPFAFTNYWSWRNGAYTLVPRGTPQYGEVFKY